ncbi:type II toxin-antitoxin system HicA family toxin [Patescibacteria group bacterium]|nr:type II toxin-antitoxin system HicA family toxin [Patescibacteria group bacterium]
MPKLVPIKPKRLAKILIKLGFAERDTEGSHVFFMHQDGRTTVVPMHNRELSKGLLRKILHDTQITVEEYDELRMD